MITGQLRKEIRQLILAESGRSEWPPLYPTKVRVAIASQDDPETGMGRLLPRQIQFWSDPIASTPDSTVTPEAEGRLITLIEIYSVRPINSPPPERFRFDNQDAEVNFINETDRYLDRFGIELTAGERQTLQR